MVGDFRLRWLDCDEHFDSGERLLIDGTPAIVVIGTNQLVNTLTGWQLKTGSIQRIEPGLGKPVSGEADSLDAVLAKFPVPGTTWLDATHVGLVTSINLKSETFTVRLDATGDIVTLPLVLESE